MIFFSGLLIFIFGTIMGSFFSTIIYRLHAGKKIFTLRSFSPHTGDPLKWYHLFPLFSYLFLKGQCAYSGKKIPLHYPALEIITALTFLTIFLHTPFITTTINALSPEVFFYDIDWLIFQKFFYQITIFSLLILIFFYDLLYQEIPDRFSLSAIAVTFLGFFIFESPHLKDSITGALTIFSFFFLQFILSKGKWIGGGDLRLGFFIGLFLGLQKGLLAIFLGYFIGSIIAIILLLSKKITRKSPIAFGPFLIIGTIIALFYGEKILNYYWSFFL